MTKEEKYQNIIGSFNATLDAQIPAHVQLSNIAALLKKEFNFFWVGFYRRRSESELVIGPYQGEVPCFFIKLGRGLCGTAAETGITQMVGNVHEYPNYIACHPESTSEIVVAGMNKGYCEFVMDVDHIEKDQFDKVDKRMLEKICEIIIERKFYIND